MEFRPFDNFESFRALLTEYYREGEDADTPPEELDGFLRYLYRLVENQIISASAAWLAQPVGFVLWAMDTDRMPFSNLPGAGTILEIGVRPAYRGKGHGRELVAYAEGQLKCDRRYVCAYGPAEGFWEKCGYGDSGKLATNGLKLLIKG